MRRSLALFSLLILGCGSSSSPPLGAQSPAPEPSLLIIGDSHAAGWHDYASDVAGTLYPGWRIRYAGVGGETSLQIEQRLPAELAKGCGVVLILAGTNDVRQLPDADTAAVYRMVDTVRAAGCTPILWKIPALPGRDVGAWNAQVAGQLDGYAVSLRPGTMRADGIHFDNEGYRQLTIALHSIIGG